MKKLLLIMLVFLLTFGSVFAGGKKEEAQGGLDKITLRTNWLWYGSHSVFFLGINKGFYEEEGIDLTVKQGNGSGSTVRLVANKDSTFAYASAGALINLAATGAPVVSIATIDATGVDAVIARPDSGIKTPKDLEGKKILTTASAGVNLFFPLFCKNAGVDINKVQLTNVADSAIVPSYLQNLAPAILGGLDDKPAEIVANGGAEPVTFNYADYGVDQPGYALVAHTDMVKNNPDLVQRFVRATLKSVAYAEKNPDEAIDALIDWSANTGENKTQARRVLDVTLSILYSNNNKDKKLGLNVPADWESAVKLMKEYNDLKTDRKVTDFYTNKFIK